jgi:hypothetical protein
MHIFTLPQCGINIAATYSDVDEPIRALILMRLGSSNENQSGAVTNLIHFILFCLIFGVLAVCIIIYKISKELRTKDME